MPGREEGHPVCSYGVLTDWYAHRPGITSSDVRMWARPAAVWENKNWTVLLGHSGTEGPSLEGPQSNGPDRPGCFFPRHLLILNGRVKRN